MFPHPGARFRARTALQGSPNGDRGFLSFEDNDLAVEWCENRLYGEAAGTLDIAATLADSPLLRGVPETLVRRLEAAAHTDSFKPGTHILHTGEQGDGRMFFIETGQVSILVPLRDGGGHLRIATLGPGMNFGEMALLGHTTRSASVHADTAIRCRAISIAEFDRIADEFPRLKILLLENLARDMANRLRGANQ